MIVPNGRALLIAIDEYLHPALGPVPYAGASAGKLAAALARIGIAATQLAGKYATHAAIASYLRRWKKAAKPGDVLLLWFRGRSFTLRGKSHLAAWDTLPDDAVDTSLSLAEIAKELRGAKCDRIVLLLDSGADETAKESPGEPGLDAVECAKLAEHIAILSPGAAGEPSITATGTNATLWTSALAEAFSGRWPDALTPERTITAATLQRAIRKHWPGMLRKYSIDADAATPQHYGDADFAIADLSARIEAETGQGWLTEARLQSLSFRSVQVGRVRDLKGFRKSFQLPETAGPSSRQFIAKCASEDIRDDLDLRVAVLRDRMQMKRKEIEVQSHSDGSGTVRTDAFEYAVGVELNAADPTTVTWTRELRHIREASSIRSPEFEAAFGELFDELLLDFAAPIDLNDLVDRLEALPGRICTVAILRAGEAYEATFDGFAGAMRLERRRLTLKGRSASMASLLDRFLAFVAKAPPLSTELALPAKT